MINKNYSNDFLNIEKKWQNKWENEKIFNATNKGNKKFYLLEMFPYPSGAGLHMGHALNYTISDVLARFKRQQGYNVLYPQGYDAFGLPAENAAIKVGEHPFEYTKKAMQNFSMQQKSLGLSYDKNSFLITCSPEYYKWNQYFFTKFFENGLVYKKKSAVNWCKECNTVLANEQVHEGKCWRHPNCSVDIKQLEQWYINTSKYSEELLKELPNLDWPERIKTLQRNWIGKSTGTEVLFEINNEDWKVFTTRPDTIYGVTYLVISAQHEKLMQLVSNDQKEKVLEFLKEVKSVSEKEMESMEKLGVFTGSYAINPLTNDKIPVYVGNFVVADYASGMVMAVPAHDQRDYEFAKKYNINIKSVIKPENEELNIDNKAYTQEGILINSQEFNGMKNKEAIKKITEKLEKINKGKFITNYKLRDWLVSRQRYWGTPIPIIYCDKCGVVSVPEKDLPVELPKDIKFGKGNPLETSESFLNVKCPKCGGKAKRETDTMDTFFDSSWYYLRYLDSKNNSKPFEKEIINYWMPVDFYIGGAEHACMHLIYARAFTKMLRDVGLLEINEPFKKLFNQGMLHGSDGNKMSKSLGNVVNPIDMINKFGADSLRFNLMSLASPDKDSIWNERGLESSFKFLSRIYDFFIEFNFSQTSEKLAHKLNKTIREYYEDLESLKYNLGLIKLRELFDLVFEEKNISKEDFNSLMKMLCLFTPHIANELWSKYNSTDLSFETYPQCEECKINKQFDVQEKFENKLTDDLNSILKIMQKNIVLKNAYVYVLPNEKYLYDAVLNNVSKRTNLIIKIFAVNDTEKYDPENKSQKAKPGKPAIYLE